MTRALIIGGGFFGCYLALLLKERVDEVVIVEMGDELMRRASYHNQARVHGGYHYPRSLLTALRSAINLPRFTEDFGECVHTDFQKYYAIARVGSKVSAAQFVNFMGRTGSPVHEAPEPIKKMFNSDLIEDVFTVREYAFDSAVLARITRQRLDQAGVEIRFQTEAGAIHPLTEDRLAVDLTAQGVTAAFDADWVFNCTYSQLNVVLKKSGLPLIPLKQELTEMALVQPPPELDNIFVTLMCGPFFSLMPFPDRGLCTLSHVRYTPHLSWQERAGQPFSKAYEHFTKLPKVTSARFMIADSARYLPALAKCVYHDSLWEVKTVLPQSEIDDSRPILFRQNETHPRLVSIMGGKIDNVYDLPQELDTVFNHSLATV